MVQVEPRLQLVQLRTLGTDAWRMSQLEVEKPGEIDVSSWKSSEMGIFLNWSYPKTVGL